MILRMMRLIALGVLNYNMVCLAEEASILDSATILSETDWKTPNPYILINNQFKAWVKGLEAEEHNDFVISFGK